MAKEADVIAAMSLEVLKGTTRAFDACKYKTLFESSNMISHVTNWGFICFNPLVIQQVRPHVGQRRVAERLRSLLHSTVHHSEIAGKCALVTTLDGEGGGVGFLCLTFSLVPRRARS